MALDFSRNYSPPGVYIEETESTLVSMTGIPPTVVALVGPARGYRIHTQQMVLSASPVTLAHPGVDADSVRVTLAATGAEVAESDYSVTVDEETGLAQFVTAEEPDAGLGAAVFVAYHYTEPTYFDPQVFRNFEDIKDAYGEPLNPAAPVPGQEYNPDGSPLSLAAMIAIRNGATDLVLCATDTSQAAPAALRQAYAKIETEPSVNIVVPITTNVAEADADEVLGDLFSLVVTGSAEGYYRFGIAGFEPSVTTAPDALISAGLPGENLNLRRMMLAYSGPQGLQMYSGASSSSFSVGHSYLAAAYAGRMQALPVQRSLTKQSIAGFTGLSGAPLSASLKNRYASAGVAVTEIDRYGRLTVRHGVTADPRNINTREASVVRARDALVRSLAESTATSGLIGAPIDEDLLLSVKSNIQGVLESAVSDDVILSYDGLTLRQTQVDPSVVEVKFAYKPAYPLNYIVISFSIDTTTGTASINDTETI